MRSAIADYVASMDVQYVWRDSATRAVKDENALGHQGPQRGLRANGRSARMAEQGVAQGPPGGPGRTVFHRSPPGWSEPHTDRENPTETSGVERTDGATGQGFAQYALAPGQGGKFVPAAHCGNRTRRGSPRVCRFALRKQLLK